jgi:UDP-N-acetylmuramoylalanine--D-glutamate ligase
MNWASKTVAVLGAGESGRAAAELLAWKGARVVLRNSVMNSRIEQMADRMEALGVRIEARSDSSLPCRFDLAVLSPGVNPAVPMVTDMEQSGTDIISEIELAYLCCQAPVIAITGTNGKSTTTELIEKILLRAGLQTEACGNIGKPFSDVVRENRGLDVITLEVSSFQLEAIETFKPFISVYLNFTPDHLDRYDSMEDYKKAKDRILMNQDIQDFMVVNADLSLPEVKARKITISGLHDRADYFVKDGWLWAGQDKVMEQAATRLNGPHNAENMLAALAVADLYKVPRAIAVAALIDYHPLPHRCEKVRELDGVIYINDSKATNIDAMEKALLGQSDQVVLIAGGKDKGFDFKPLQALLRQKVRHAILIGEMRTKLAKVWGADTLCHLATDFKEAVLLAQKLAEPGGTVLLSPGCSSYDMFDHFEDRGEQFRNLVNQLKSNK